MNNMLSHFNSTNVESWSGFPGRVAEVFGQTPRLVSMRLLVAMLLSVVCISSTVIAQSRDPQSQQAPVDDLGSEQTKSEVGSSANSAPKRKYKLEKNVVFSEEDGTKLLCDIYIPAEEPVALRPAVVVVHGGAWISGDKWAIGLYAQSLAENGMVAVSVNYRLAPQHKFPAQLDDVRSGLCWLTKHAAEYHVDPDRIALMGYSAGAHLSCLIGVLQDAPWESVTHTTNWPQGDPRWQSMPAIQCVVAGGAPCDFTDIPPDNQGLAYFLGGTRREKPETYEAASPVAHASKDDPPILMFHGATDKVVSIESSRKLYRLHQSLGVSSRFVTYEGIGHFLTFLQEESRIASLEFLTRSLNLPVPEVD